jgi:glyoxylase-like metal-dependent hydrolase (beta-lactamase superfamily II)
LILPILRLAGKRHVQAIMARGGLREYARALDEDGEAPTCGESSAGHGDGQYGALAIPGLPDWQAIPTPGHTPGQVAFFRAKDRLLIAGDAVLTKVEPFSALLGKRARLSGPPWYFNWNRALARQSIATLAELEPLVIAGGHGRPQEGADLATKLRELAARH